MPFLTAEEFERKYGPLKAVVSTHGVSEPDGVLFSDEWFAKYGKCLEDGTFLKPVKKNKAEKSSDKGKTAATEEAKP
jgi:hypothetical protein